ncbi:hypothetical protein IGS68_17165 [Skermanella sp. TT6]|uniref:DUF2231 domain-containing protein n=1 Tax=Skermanella cutis TaxID=2775420 RepID=A0ABX7B0E9_9PROT|nr:DUF2231 domain-containing protein [Skermanella sp. TT6]QQP87805.1 hypothetical protein IGS68_17165 [Skermanella sp. TT6]
MAVAYDERPGRAIQPFHAVLLAATIPLFLGGLLSDIAYTSTYQIQWSNFASWLIAGGVAFTGFALLWAFIDLIRADRRRGRPLIYFLLLLAAFGLGLINSFVHARDAWATMPEGLVLSAIVTVLAILATWLGFSSLRVGGMK